MVSCDFIDISDGKWHTVPQNAVNIMIEANGTFGPTTVQTSHNGVLAHGIGSVNPGGAGEQDHIKLNPNQDIMMNCVRIDPNDLPIFLEGEYIRVYFNRIKL